MSHNKINLWLSIVLYYFSWSIILGSDTHFATFYIKLMEFQNHVHRRMDGTCCGTKLTDRELSITNETCMSECSLEFRICIEPFGMPVSLIEASSYSGPCVYGQTQTSHWGNTDTSYTFSEAPIYMINISSPWPLSFSLILETYDLSTMKDKRIIDRAVHRSILRPVTYTASITQTQPKEWHHVTTSTAISGYTFSMRLACQPDHYNSTCTKMCHRNNSRYTCDANGDKICEPGWSGQNCDIAICKIGCHRQHGSCSEPGECECATGWQGPYCDECIKYPGCKHGTCDDAPFTCRCLPNWGGPFCDQDLDYCGRHRPCKNGGICRNVDSPQKRFNCSCSKEFTGDMCEIQLPACSWNPCKRGRCVPKSEYDYECKCDPGWRGEHCEENIDYCLQNTCLNGGTCQDLDGVGFRCVCPPGFKGSNCQLRSPCSNSRCVHARDCTPLIPPVDGIDYNCICQPGWTGQFCDQNIDDCVDKCRNGGTCHDLIDDFYCTCPKGFYGRHCEIDQQCTNGPCQNNGICHELNDGYRCECPDGYTGHNCEIAVGSCDPNPCQNAAYCYTLSQGFYCKCSPSHYGRYCEHDRPYCGPNGCMQLTDPCFSGRQLSNNTLAATKDSGEVIFSGLSVCGLHGTCISSETTPDGFLCACNNNFRGKFCQEPVNFCDRNPCLHGGVCINGPDNFECICEEGFAGTQCQTPVNMCQPNPCQNGGYCQNAAHPGDFHCSCPVGWSGRWCQLKTEDPCGASKVCFNKGVCQSDPTQPGGFRCECDATWMGSVCHLRRPESRACANRTLCQNGATCVDVGDSFNCVCRPGFDGQFCENDINECNSSPCYNNGTCRDLVNAYECVCPDGFKGADCQINIDECATNPCAYGATCIDKVGDYECICPEGRHGRNCEEVHIHRPPKPPACNFRDRVYDHNETWVYNCQNCQCNMGQIICEDDFCGYWSCLQAVGHSDRFACKPGEVCHTLSSGQEDCFVAPCYLRTVCLNATQSIPIQLRRLLPQSFPGSASFGCRPNAVQLNNRCARITLEFSKQRLPYGVTVSDVCNAVRQLPSVTRLQTRPNEIMGFGISCDIQAALPNMTHNNIEVTLSSTDETLFTNLEGKEYSLIHLLAQNISREVAMKASSNLTLNKMKTKIRYYDDGMPLPPMSQLLGTELIDLYWHRVLLGVVQITVDTVAVKDKDYGPPILTPFACGLILLTSLISVIFICVYAQRKHHELLLKYTPETVPNNQQINGCKSVRNDVPNEDTPAPHVKPARPAQLTTGAGNTTPSDNETRADRSRPVVV